MKSWAAHRFGFSLLLLGCLCACSDTLEKSFASMADIPAQGMVARGWIPSGIPTTATDVQIRWNIDTNSVRGRLRIQAGDIVGLTATMRVLEADVVPPFWPHGDVTPLWWPRQLNPPATAATMRRQGWEILAPPDARSTFVAVRRNDGQLYFWTEGS